MSIVYSVVLGMCLLLSILFGAIKCRTRPWLCAFMVFLAAYTGLILLDSFDVRISPTAYVLTLSITFLPGPLILGYVSQISTRNEVNAKDFSLALLPIVLALFCSDLLGGYPVFSIVPRSAYQLDSYIMIFNTLSAMAGLHLAVYLSRAFSVLMTLRKDWAAYQSKTLPESWYDMIKVLMVVIVANVSQVLSAFLNPIGSQVSVGDIGFMILLAHFLYIAVRTTYRAYHDGPDESDLIYREADLFLETAPLQSNRSEEALRIENYVESQKLYLIPELSLTMLAEKVETTPHKLTEILNTEMQKNFYEYINDLRIAYAANYLLEHPKKSVTEVFYSAGFSNKSTFYGHFKKVFKMTPSDFRTSAVESNGATEMADSTVIVSFSKEASPTNR